MPPVTEWGFLDGWNWYWLTARAAPFWAVLGYFVASWTSLFIARAIILGVHTAVTFLRSVVLTDDGNTPPLGH